MILTDEECRDTYNAAMEAPDRSTVSVSRAIEAAVVARLAAGVSAEPEAIRHSFDGYGWMYIDNGSGSSWQDMDYPHKESLVTLDQLTTAIAAARVQALEEAIEVTRGVLRDESSELNYRGCGEVQSAIRALIGEKI